MPKNSEPPKRGRPRFGTPRAEKVERFNITMTKDVSERLDKFCEYEERPRSWVVQKAVDKWLSEKGY